MKSLLTVSCTVLEAADIVRTTMQERSGADNCNVSIELPRPMPAAFSGEFDLNAPLPLAVMKVFIEQPHNKIHQIKVCREVTGWGLKEAKDYIENIWYNYFSRTNPLFS